jgi:c-di-GMP-binding flagellar brake protein YcgR
MEQNVVEFAASKALLRKAGEKNAPLDLVRLLEAGPDSCRSRFVEAPGAALAVEVPSRQGHLVPVRDGEEVEVYFRIEDNRYFFQSRVKSRETVALSAAVDLPVLILDYPRVIEKRQRRRYYRVNMRLAKPLMAELRLLDQDGKKASRIPEAPTMEIADLSVEGLRLVYEKAGRCPLAKGQRLSVKFSLGQDESIKLTALVQHVSSSSAEVSHIGLQFEGLEDSYEGRLLRGRLLRFTTERERAELHRVSQLKQG